jgi:hypothetical protein
MDKKKPHRIRPSERAVVRCDVDYADDTANVSSRIGECLVVLSIRQIRSPHAQASAASTHAAGAAEAATTSGARHARCKTSSKPEQEELRECTPNTSLVPPS